jgi:hypothetical protein
MRCTSWSASPVSWVVAAEVAACFTASSSGPRSGDELLELR